MPVQVHSYLLNAYFNCLICANNLSIAALVSFYVQGCTACRFCRSKNLCGFVLSPKRKIETTFTFSKSGKHPLTTFADNSISLPIAHTRATVHYTGSVSNINPIGDASAVIVLAITLAIFLTLMPQVSI